LKVTGSEVKVDEGSVGHGNLVNPIAPVLLKGYETKLTRIFPHFCGLVRFLSLWVVQGSYGQGKSGNFEGVGENREGQGKVREF